MPSRFTVFFPFSTVPYFPGFRFVLAGSNRPSGTPCASVVEQIYVALFPCNECAKLIIQSGIREVIYLSDKVCHDWCNESVSYSSG